MPDNKSILATIEQLATAWQRWQDQEVKYQRALTEHEDRLKQQAYLSLSWNAEDVPTDEQIKSFIAEHRAELLPRAELEAFDQQDSYRESLIAEIGKHSLEVAKYADKQGIDAEPLLQSPETANVGSVTRTLRKVLIRAESMEGSERPEGTAADGKHLNPEALAPFRLEDFAIPSITDPEARQHSMKRCREFEWASRLSPDTQQAQESLVRKLWDDACRLGGVENPPPERPRVTNREEAFRAIASLHRWAEQLAGGTGKDDAGQQVSKQSEGTTEGDTQPKKLEDLAPADRKAYLSYLYAESKRGLRLEDRDAHALLKEEGIPDNAGNPGDLTDYKLPSFDTWARQLRNARKALGEQKHERRRGRPTGSSVVRQDQIEQSERDE